MTAARTLCGYYCTGVVGFAGAPGTAVSDRNPTTAPSNLVPVSAALGEEAGGEHHSLLWATAEAPLLSLIIVQLLSLEEEKAEEGLGGGGGGGNQESRY